MTIHHHRDRSKPCPYCGGRSRDGHLCAKCTADTARRLSDLPTLWIDLQQQITRQTRYAPTGSPISTSRAPEVDQRPRGLVCGEIGRPMPYDVDASDVAHKITRGTTVIEDGQATIRNGIVGWVRITIDDLGAPAPRDGITDLCEHLASWLPELRKHEACNEFAADVWGWVDAITAAIDIPDRPGRAKVGPCVIRGEDGEWCSGTLWAMLDRSEDTSEVHCDTCTHTWDGSRYLRLARDVERRKADLERSARLARAVIGA